MASSLETFRRLRELYKFPSRSGSVETLTPRVKLFWSTEKIRRTPTLPNLSIVILISGRKTAYVAGGQIHYDKDNYLVVSAPVPFECASDSTEREPLLGMTIDIDLPTLTRFANIPGAVPFEASEELTPLPIGLQPVPIEMALSDASARLVHTLCSPTDTQALGPSIADEIVYRALKGRHRSALLALANQSSNHARITRAIARIHQNSAKPLAVEDLAHAAGMSIRTFYRAFKEVTSKTPLQYIKIVRLNIAMTMLQNGSHDVGAVARAVGYESGSQFSREFKKYFAMSPTVIITRRRS